MTGRRLFDDERPNPKKIVANLNELSNQIYKHLSSLTDCATGSAYTTIFSIVDHLKDKIADDKGKEYLAAIKSLMIKFSENVENFRSVKDEIEEKMQTQVSLNIKKLVDSMDGVIGRVKKSSHLINIKNFKIDLEDIQNKLSYSWKATQPYEPPKPY